MKLLFALVLEVRELNAFPFVLLNFTPSKLQTFSIWAGHQTYNSHFIPPSLLIFGNHLSVKGQHFLACPCKVDYINQGDLSWPCREVNWLSI